MGNSKKIRTFVAKTREPVISLWNDISKGNNIQKAKKKGNIFLYFFSKNSQNFYWLAIQGDDVRLEVNHKDDSPDEVYKTTGFPKSSIVPPRCLRELMGSEGIHIHREKLS